MTDTILQSKHDFGYRENRAKTNLDEFLVVLNSRRSVRVFTEALLPEDDVEKIIHDGLKAPNSSNLQPWEFHWVRDSIKKQEVAKACFGQNGAKTASDLIVCVARTDTWKLNAKHLLKLMKDKSETELPKQVVDYYTKIVPFAYGKIGVLSPIKWLLIKVLGIWQLVPREPIWPRDLKSWAIKSTALACENIMLSARARGYDSLPMEGYDSKRLKKVLSLSKHQHLVMVIALGHASEKGIYGPQMRLDSKQFVHKY